MMEGRRLLYCHILILISALFISNTHVTPDLANQEQLEEGSILPERKDEAGNLSPTDEYGVKAMKSKHEEKYGVCRDATTDNPICKAGSRSCSGSNDHGKDPKALKRISKIVKLLKKIGLAVSADYLKEYYGPKKVKALIAILLVDELFFESEIYEAFESFLVNLPFLMKEIYEENKPYILNQLPRYSESYEASKSYIIKQVILCKEFLEAVKLSSVSSSRTSFLLKKLVASLGIRIHVREFHLLRISIKAIERINTLQEFLLWLEEYISVLDGYLPESKLVLSNYTKAFMFIVFLCFGLIRG